jgi:hypothetical protein
MLLLRKARPEDKAKVFEVEAKSMPSLQYLPQLYDDWSAETIGDLSVVEYNGGIIGVGKYSRLPDGTAWLEALRVTPEKQGLGGGKILYEHWFKLAKQQHVDHMRMYTNMSNAKSKGLAERFGLRVEGTYREALLPKDAATVETTDFERVTDPEKAEKLLMPQSQRWGGFIVMNRTFYKLNPLTCAYFGKQGMVYHDEASSSTVTLGARFMPWQSLHIGIMSGNYEKCLKFSMAKGVEGKVGRLSILFPPDRSDVQASVTGFGFKISPEDYITMGIAV